MKRGYYLWDWWSSKTIGFDADIGFHDDEYAKRQDAYRRFADAKRQGIRELEISIEIAQEQLESLRKLNIEDVKK